MTSIVMNMKYLKMASTLKLELLIWHCSNTTDLSFSGDSVVFVLCFFSFVYLRQF